MNKPLKTPLLCLAIIVAISSFSNLTLAMPHQHDMSMMTDTSEHSEQASTTSLIPQSQISILRNPDYSNGYNNKHGSQFDSSVSNHHMMSNPDIFALDLEKFELIKLGNNSSAQYDLKLWYGNDDNRIFIENEGTVERQHWSEASTSVSWWRPLSPFWNTLAGIKQDYGNQQLNQFWLGAGITGLAPYWLDVEAKLWLSRKGQTELELHGSYDGYITQKMVVKPEITLIAFGKNEPQNHQGAGLAEFKTGFRLRYDITPQFAPYIGWQYHRMLGNTADFTTDDESENSAIIGLHFWY